MTKRYELRLRADSVQASLQRYMDAFCLRARTHRVCGLWYKFEELGRASIASGSDGNDSSCDINSI